MLDWMKHKLEIKIDRRKINNLRHADETILMAESVKITPLLSNGPGIQRGALQSILPSYYYTSPPGARRAVPGRRRIASSLPSGPGNGKERPNSGSDQPVYFLSPQDSVRAKNLPFLTDILWHPWDFSCSSECTSLRMQEFSAP